MRGEIHAVVERVLDGLPVNWDDALRDARDDSERAMLEDLRTLADAVDPGAARPAGPWRWGPLEVSGEIARGAYGVVYRARDTRLGRDVALKLFADASEQNLDEARRLARISHPHVVAVYGADRFDDQSGLWMELIGGRTLDAILEDAGPFSEHEATGIAIEVCHGVAAIHAAGLLHRDIKAQNVMRERGGRLVLMDLGASVPLADPDLSTASLAGTPLYLAPELFDGVRPSVASDIYAIGVLLYRLVSATFPVDGQTLGDIRRAHRAAAHKPLRDARPHLSSAFVRVIERCLDADPGARYASVAALERALHLASVSADEARKGRRSRWMVAAAIIALAAGGGATLSWWLLNESSPGQRWTRASISTEQYALFSGFEELAFSRRLDDPQAAATATTSAMAQIRPALPGQHGVFALLYARLAASARRAGDLGLARQHADDAEAHLTGSVGDQHPYAAVVALESARIAQAQGDHRMVGTQILRALEIRSRLLGLDPRRTPLIDPSVVERESRAGAQLADSDGDGLLDLVERAGGLNPAAADHGADFMSIRAVFGLVGDPFLTWAHAGGSEPRSIVWQMPDRFPSEEGSDPDSRPPFWSLTARQSLTYFEQHVARAQTDRARARGFSMFIRAQPVDGLSSFVVDTSPGPRFDVALRRVDDQSVDASLLSSVIPRQGQTVRVHAPVNGHWPLYEMRCRPNGAACALIVDEKLVLDGYVGHQQYRGVSDGSIVWGVGPLGDGGHDLRASVRVALVWVEIY